MAVADYSTMMQGIGTNPAIFLRAADLVAGKCSVVTNIGFVTGKAVEGTYQGQTLMETAWFPTNTLNNIVIPTLYIYGSGCVSYVDSLSVYVYKRMSTDQPLYTNYSDDTTYEYKEMTAHYIDGISNAIGAVPHANEVNRPASRFFWFDPKYEYKFVVKVNKLTTGATIYLGGIYLQPHTSTAIMGARQFTWTSGTVQDSEKVPILDGIYWTVSANSSGAFTKVLTSEFMVGDGTISGEQASLLHSIEAVVTSDLSTSVADDTHQLLTYTQASETNGGYEVVCTGAGYGANAVLIFQTLIFGHQAPVVI